MIEGAILILIITISSFLIGFAAGTIELLQTLQKGGENMEESLEGFKKRIECLEAENKEIREYSRKLKDADERLFDKWSDLEQLLTSISACIRFVDKEKAFDEIVKVFNEVNQ